LRILERLCQPDFLAFTDDKWEGLVKHASYHEAKGLGVDESVMWGDYWFLDAIDQVGSHLAEQPSSPAQLGSSSPEAN
jgi:unsaturated chondroitin disaccharide hydrolase